VTVVEWSERLSYGTGQAVEIEIQDAGDDRRILRVYFPGTGQPERSRSLDGTPGKSTGRRSRKKK